jgi:site-specific recombinase XerD
MRRAMVMTLYSTGIRCSELCHLKVSNIDSQRMVIHVHKGNPRVRALRIVAPPPGAPQRPSAGH